MKTNLDRLVGPETETDNIINRMEKAVKPEPAEAVGHASVEFGAQQRPSTAIGNTQTDFDDEAHIDSTPVIAESGVIVKGKPGMIVKGLIQGTPLVWKSTQVQLIPSLLRTCTTVYYRKRDLY